MLSKCAGWAMLSLACPRLPSASGQCHYPPGWELHGGLSQAPAAGCFPGPLHLHRQVYPDPPEAACGEAPAGSNLRPLFPSSPTAVYPTLSCTCGPCGWSLEGLSPRSVGDREGRCCQDDPVYIITHQETMTLWVESVGRNYVQVASLGLGDALPASTVLAVVCLSVPRRTCCFQCCQLIYPWA